MTKLVTVLVLVTKPSIHALTHSYVPTLKYIRLAILPYANLSGHAMLPNMHNGIQYPTSQ